MRAGRTYAGGALLETGAEMGPHLDMGDRVGMAAKYPGSKGACWYLVALRTTVARVWKPVCTNAFLDELIEGEVVWYGKSRLSELQGGQ